MMTAMARLPCKQTTSPTTATATSPPPRHHRRQLQQQQQQQQHHPQQQHHHQQSARQLSYSSGSAGSPALPSSPALVLASTPTHHHRHHQSVGGGGGVVVSGPSFAQSRGYWEMQQAVMLQSHQTPQHLQQQQQLQQQSSYARSHHRHHPDHVGKRKSAVELLQETKAFYVKSEIVLDRKQELKNSGHLQVSQLTAPGAPPRLLRKCTIPVPAAQTCALQQHQMLQQQQQQQQLHQLQQHQQQLQQQQLQQQQHQQQIQQQQQHQQQLAQQQQQQQSSPCCWSTCHENDRPLPPKSPRLVPLPQRRSVSGPAASVCLPNSEQLQAKLRRLLNTDSKENVFFPETPTPPPSSAGPTTSTTSLPPAPAEYANNGGGGGGHHLQQLQQQQQQQQQILQRDDKFRYSPGGSLSPGCCRDDERALWGAAGTTAGNEVRFKFGRSNSHSHGGAPVAPSSGGRRSHGGGGGSIARSTRPTAGVVVVGGGGSNSSAIEDIGGAPVICHKSLPDLHTSTRRRASLSPRASTRSSSRKSSQQQQQQQQQQLGGGGGAGDYPDCETGSDYSDRSFNRDSVRYRSSRHIRRSLGSGGGDASSVLSSGGRTQKSSGSSKLSHGATARDSGGSSGHCTHRSEPPPRIQDCWSHARRDSGASTQHSTERDRSRKSAGSYNNGTPPPPAIVRRYSPETESSNSQTDYSPTCNSRFSDGWKEGRGRPILRSKSDISDRYWRQEGAGVGGAIGSLVGTTVLGTVAPGSCRGVLAPPPPSGNSTTTTTTTKHQQQPSHQQQSSSSSSGVASAPRAPRSVAQLESFFDRLGLDQDNFQRIAEPSSRSSSPVFFDSVSSVDSALGLYPSAWAAAAVAAAAATNGANANNNQNCSADNENECPAGGQQQQRNGGPAADQPSIVERNARIIKWLCQCRKVQFGYS